MAEKQFNTRIINKHDIAANWAKATNFIPKKGELIVYDADTTNTQPRLKIGDGTTTVINLPFVTDITNIGEALAALDYNGASANGTATQFITQVTQADGLVSATKASIPSAGTNLGMVKTGGDVTISSGIITVNDDSHSHIISNVDGLQDALNAKATPGQITEALAALDYTSPSASTTTSTTFIDTVSQTDGVISATKKTIPTANGTTLGMVKQGGDVTISSGVITVNDDSHNHVISNVDGLQSALDAKATPANITSAIAALDYTSPETDGTALEFITTVSQTDGVVSATKAAIPVASSDTLGLVKSGTDITVDASGNVSVKNNSHTHTIANVTNLQSTLDAKATPAQITSAIAALDASDPTASGTATSFISTISQTDGVISATKASLPTAGTSLGMVKSGGDVTISSGTITVKDDSHNHVISNVDGLQDALDAKATPANITSAIAALDYTGATASGNATSFITQVTQTDGVVSATKASIPIATSSQAGLVKSGTDITVDTSGNVTVKNNSHSHTSANISDLSTTISTAITNAIGALDASDPAASGSATQFITSISQKDGVITATKANITAAALGLSGAMKFLGTSATAITDGATTNPITIGSTSTTVASGNVVLYGSKEFVWNGSAWEELGNEGSYKVQQSAVSSPSASGTTTAFIDTISQNAQGVITATKKTVASATQSAAGLMSAADKKKLDGITASADTVAFAQNATSGNKVGTITINGTATDMYSPTQTSVSGNAGTATTLKNARAIDGVSFNGSAAITHYGECSTAAATVAKTVALTGFTLVTGARIAVKFTVTNTASNPTLNVNSTGAKAIMYRGSAITKGYLAANRVYEFVYDGTDWELIGDINTDTHYTTRLYAGASGAVANAAATSPYLTVTDNNTYRNQVRFVGSGATTVSSDANGNITISSTDNNTTYSAATSSAAGLMSAADKAKLDGIASGANKTTVDSALSSSSTNPVQNKVINTALGAKAPTSHASTATTYGAASASNYGHAMASSTTPKANGTAAVGSETAKFARGDHVHPLQTTVSGNAGTATKLATARTISLTGDVTGSASFDGSANVSIAAAVANDSHSHSASTISSVNEANLQWGGKNFSGAYGPIDAAMISILGADRLAFGKPEGIAIEYSTDSGSTWKDYGATDTQKNNLFSSGAVSAGLVIGKNTTVSSSIALNKYMLRITIDTDVFRVYTALNKFAIYVTTSGSSGCYCTIDGALESTPTTFVNFANQIPISGWSGWNIINTSNIVTYGNTASAHYGKLRFTFGCTGGTAATYTGLAINNIMGFGGVGWTTPSNMAKYGHLYSWDGSQNATFPAKVTATGGFSGSLSGNATTATNVAWSGITSKPSYYDAKAIKSISRSGTTFTATHLDGSTSTFTQQDNNTTYNAATQSAAGLMSAADKAKLDGIATGATANTGDITGVTAGNGLTGGGSSGSVTLNVGAGFGITVAADTVSVNTSYTTSGKNYKVAVDSTTGGLYVNVPWTDNNTDTKNTAGSTNSDSKLFLIGATSQAANPQTYSDSEVYTTNGTLTAKTFSGSGASLTSLNASNISSGTIAAARLPAATTSAQGAMTSAMVTKLNGIATGATKDIAITTAEINSICV